MLVLTVLEEVENLKRNLYLSMIMRASDPTPLQYVIFQLRGGWSPVSIKAKVQGVSTIYKSFQRPIFQELTILQ